MGSEMCIRDSDSNGDGTQEDNEPMGELPVISRHELGSGQIILISDPSFLINGMDKIAGNSSFIQNIAGTTPELYIDQSHLTPSDLHHTRRWLQDARSLLTTPVGTVILVIAAIMAALIPIWHKKKEAAVET